LAFTQGPLLDIQELLLVHKKIGGHEACLKSYSLKHERGDELFPLLKAYREAVNRVLEELWNSIEWKKRKVNGKKQWRLLPKYKVDIHSREYKKKLRDSLLEDLPYAAHWVDSAIKTAYSIFKSWRKNYVKGERKRNKPTARRLFALKKGRQKLQSFICQFILFMWFFMFCSLYHMIYICRHQRTKGSVCVDSLLTILLYKLPYEKA
jgi:hypothetical protein